MVVGNAVARNWWYGHYDPLHLPPVPEKTCRDLFLGNVGRQGPTAAHIIEAFAAARDFLPMLCPVVSRLLGATEEQIPIQFGTPAASPQFFHGPGGRYLVLPDGVALGVYLADLLRVIAPWVPLPTGVELPPIQMLPSANAVEAALWQRFAWQSAFGASFLFQVALEMDQVEMQDLFRLTPTELALFHLLRTEGLAGVAAQYSAFMKMDDLQAVGRAFRKQAPQFVDVVAEVPPWSPPDRGRRPGLPITVFDRQVDRFRRWAQGMYAHKRRLALVSENEAQRIQRLLTGDVRSAEDVHAVVRATWLIAPSLANHLLRPEYLGQVTFRLHDDSAIVQPTTMSYATPTILKKLGWALPWAIPQPEDRVELLIQKGMSKQDLLPKIIKTMAVLQVPDELYQYAKRAYYDCVSTMIPTLEWMAEVDAGWGATAWFEFVYQAKQRGMLFTLSPGQEQQRTLLMTCGLGVLCERWELRVSPFVRQVEQWLWRNAAEGLYREVTT